MWRWCFCILFVLPFVLLPILWLSFPTSCEAGHIHYAHDSEDTADAHEPWLCHVPRHTGWACTPNCDCFTGGIYGPTNNGTVFLFAIVIAIAAMYYCIFERHSDIDYIDYNNKPSGRRFTRKLNRRGLNDYPVR